MAWSIQELRESLTREGVRFFENPQQPQVLFGATGLHTTYQVMVTLLNDGQFLQFRTLRYLECPRQHPNLPALTRTLASINYELRLVKFAWDVNDGEVVAYADAWLMDGRLTQSQFNRMLGNFLPGIDLSYRRLREAMERGEDPGPITMEQAMEDLLSRGSLPPELRERLEAMRKAGGKSPGIDSV